MMKSKALYPGDLVKAKGCDGVARVKSIVRINRQVVYLLDQQLSVKFRHVDLGIVIYVPFWTFKRCDLIKLEKKESSS